MHFIKELIKNESPRKTNTRVFGILAAILCLAAFLFTRGNDSSAAKQPDIALSEAVYSAAAELTGTDNSPENGFVFFRKYERNPASLHITNNALSDARIRLCDGLFNKSVMDFYVCAGSEATLSVPVGYYEFHTATGENWVDDTQLFGQSTLFFTDSSEHGQELGRKATCEFTIEKAFSNMIPIEKDRY